MDTRQPHNCPGETCAAQAGTCSIEAVVDRRGQAVAQLFLKACVQRQALGVGGIPANEKQLLSLHPARQTGRMGTLSGGRLPQRGKARKSPNSERCWRALRHTKPQVPSYTPAIKIACSGGQPDSIAASAEEKEEVFIRQAFPRQVSTEDDIAIPDTTA